MNYSSIPILILFLFHTKHLNIPYTAFDISQLLIFMRRSQSSFPRLLPSPPSPPPPSSSSSSPVVVVVVAVAHPFVAAVNGAHHHVPQGRPGPPLLPDSLRLRQIQQRSQLFFPTLPAVLQLAQILLLPAKVDPPAILCMWRLSHAPVRGRLSSQPGLPSIKNLLMTRPAFVATSRTSKQPTLLLTIPHVQTVKNAA